MTLRRGLPGALLAAALCAASPLSAAAADASHAPFQFGVIAHSFKSAADDTILRRAIRETNEADLAFVVATGIKSAAETCADKLYSQRRTLLDDSARPLVVSLAASDWSDCKNSLGRSVAIERLNRLREVFFPDDQSLGARKLPMLRLSATAKFRSYAENAHWESGQVLFATVNWPANNNHYLPEAGRNSEFEDRLVANRAWLQRLFSTAKRKKLDGLVLFSDGNVGVTDENRAAAASGRQDGFAETRRLIRTLAQNFPGKVLLIDTQNTAAVTGGAGKIGWRGNIGHLSVTTGWAEIHVAGGDAGAPLFTVKGGGAEK